MITPIVIYRSLILLATLVTIATAQQPRTIGASISQTPANGYWSGIGHRAALGLKLCGADFNTTISLRIEDDNGNFTTMLGNYARMKQEDPNILYIGPIGSPANLFVRDILLLPQSKSMLGINVAAKEFYTQVSQTDPVLISVNPSAPVFGLGPLAHLRSNRAKTMTVIRANQQYVSQICSGVIDAAPDYGIQVLTIVDVPVANSINITSEAHIANLTLAVDKVIEDGADVIYMCDFTGGLVWVLQELKRRDYTPKAFVNGYYSMSEVNLLPDPTLFAYVIGTENIHPAYKPRIVGGSGVNATGKYPTFDAFARAYFSKFGEEADAVPGFSYIACSILANVLQFANDGSNTTEEELFDLIVRTRFNTFMGQFKWDSDLSQSRDNIGVQLQSTHADALQTIVSPLSAADAEFIYPMPTWQERVPRDSITLDLSRPLVSAEITFFTFSCILITLAIWVMVLIFIFRENEKMRAAQWIQLEIGMIGSICIFLAPFVWRVEDGPLASFCIVGPALPALGGFICFGVLVCKAWRIWKLYSNQTLAIFSITDWHVVAVLLVGVIIPFIVLLASWSIVGNPSLEVVVVDPFRPSLNYAKCAFASPNASVPVWMMVGLGGLLLLVGCFFAWKSNVIRSEQHDDAKPTAVCIFIDLFLAVAIFAVELGMQNNHDLETLRYSLRSAFILLAGLVPICVLGYARLTLMVREGDTSRSSVNGRFTSSSGSSIKQAMSSSNNSTHSQNSMTTAATPTEMSAKNGKKKRTQSR